MGKGTSSKGKGKPLSDGSAQSNGISASSGDEQLNKDNGKVNKGNGKPSNGDGKRSMRESSSARRFRKLEDNLRTALQAAGSTDGWKASSPAKKRRARKKAVEEKMSSGNVVVGAPFARDAGNPGTPDTQPSDTDPCNAARGPADPEI